MSQDKLQKIFREVDDLIHAREYMAAERILLHLMEQHPKHPEVHYLLGEVYCKLGKFDLAVEHEKIAYLILPDNPQILNLLGWAYFMHGDIDLGREYMEKALVITPDNVRLLCDLAVLEMRAGNKKAMEYARKAVVLDPSDPMAQEVAFVTQNVFTAMGIVKNKKKAKNTMN